MVFSSSFFLFGFLPLVLLAYFSCPRALKNVCLLALSLVFYAWGEGLYVLLMLGSIGFNFVIGHAIQSKGSHFSRFALGCGIFLNLGVLAVAKYAAFLMGNVNLVLTAIGVAELSIPETHLPIGISFYTFQAISYLVDVYRGEVKAQSKFVNLGLYIALFPQLIAGPIIRYHDIDKQIESRSVTLRKFSRGIRRFTFGLAKKVLIANTMGEVADKIFSLPVGELGFFLAWIGVAAYALQIYFDFSGYSDMAIGLGRMFGFSIRENFRYPYVAQSIQEFWRRWHISLSTWFRDYLYIPLGGNRVGRRRTYLNLLIVFFLCGLWHGAAWTFVIWGLYHGALLILERGAFGVAMERLPKLLRHFYALIAVLVGWVFFRAADVTQAFLFLSAMFDVTRIYAAGFPDAWQLHQLVPPEAALAFAVGVILSRPISIVWLGSRVRYAPLRSGFLQISMIFELLLLSLSVSKAMSGSYDPFIYFRF